MSVDVLQERIRKTKNPTILELALPVSCLPGHILAESGSEAAAYGRFCRELLTALKDLIPAVRLSFSCFALLGPEGLAELSSVLDLSGKLGYYVLMDAPELNSPNAAQGCAEAVWGENGYWPCDGLVLPAYLGSDILKPFLPYCREQKRDIFAAVRTGNRSASELQDLLAGSRLVHITAADYVNRYGSDTVGRCGYARVGIMGAASSADSLRTLRSKYPRLFLLVDGYDYPSANAKNCAQAFDRMGHGAAVCGSTGITCAWQEEQSDGTDYLEHAKNGAARMKKNLTRYMTVL